MRSADSEAELVTCVDGHWHRFAVTITALDYTAFIWIRMSYCMLPVVHDVLRDSLFLAHPVGTWSQPRRAQSVEANQHKCLQTTKNADSNGGRGF